MPISSLSITTSTFFEWLTKTNQLIVIANLSTEGQQNSTGTLTLTNDSNLNGGVTLNVASGMIKGDGGLLSNVGVASLESNTFAVVSNSATITVSQSPAFLGGTVYLDIGDLSTSVLDQSTANIASANSVNTAMNQATYATLNGASAYNRGNTAFFQANVAYTQANTGISDAAAASTKAGVAHDKANSAFAAANNAVTDYSPAFNQANAAFARANTANVNAANASFMSTGTVISARISGSYTGITAVGTLTSLTSSGVIYSTSGGFRWPNGTTVPNLTVSTSAPSGGVNGDIWIQI